jgi:hypothetical protein
VFSSEKSKYCLIHVVECRWFSFDYFVVPSRPSAEFQVKLMGSRPSRRFLMRMAFVPPIDNISAVVPCFCVSAIESILFCRFWKPPRTAEIFNQCFFYFTHQRTWEELRRSWSSTSVLLVCLHRCDSPLPRLVTASLPFLHRHLRYKPALLLCLCRRMRKRVRRLPSERDTIGCI